MKIIQLPVNPFQMNCYIYYNENTKEGVIFDPAVYGRSEEKYLIKLIEKEEIKIKYIINTHGHIDHILGNKFAKENFNVPILMHKDDRVFIERAYEQGNMFGVNIPAIPDIDEEIDENTNLNVADINLKFIHTPGHSPGSVSIIDEENKNIFYGDVIFKN